MIIGYKGFDRNLQCLGFQYEIGRTYTTEEAPVLCESGFHFCENPLDVLNYYFATYSRYCLVEGNGRVDREEEGHKIAVSEITIVKELSLYEMIQHASKQKDGMDLSGREKFVLNSKEGHLAKTNRYFGIAVSEAPSASAYAYGGLHVVAITEGRRSVAVAEAGDLFLQNRALALTEGSDSIAIAQNGSTIAMTTGAWSGVDVHGSSSMGIAYGDQNVARGELGCWLVLTEWHYGEIVGVQAVQVDGDTIKPDTWYRLVDGRIVEYEYANNL